jgi:hypothetical protein
MHAGAASHGDLRPARHAAAFVEMAPPRESGAARIPPPASQCRFMRELLALPG